MKLGKLGPFKALAVALVAALAPVSLAATPLLMASPATAQETLTGGTMRIGTSNDMSNYDPMQFSTINFFLIKNLYDSLIEYTEDGEAIPSLAESWEISDDNTSVTLKLRSGVKFHSGADLTSADVAATLAKAADPQKGKNVYSTMAIVDSWETPDPSTITVKFKQPVPTRQITDLLQFTIVIEAAGIDTVETVPAGTGPFKLEDRVVGQSVTMVANEDYWREGQPILDRLEFTIFSDQNAALAAVESGSIDMMYGAQPRGSVRLRDAGFQLISGPGKLVQVFRINTTRAPFDNEKFRQAFNYLMDRESILRVGYAGLGEVTALPWAPASDAVDPSYNETYAYNLDKAKELLDASGLSDAEMSDWSLTVNGSSADVVNISQIVQASLAEVGINIELDLKESAELNAAMLSGDFDAIFGGVGNVQKFPSRVSTNSIYRTSNNPVLKDPHPHPAYVEAIARVDSAFGEDVQAAYDNLNKVLVESAFAIPTNSYESVLILASPKVGGFIADMDNLLVARGLGFKQ